MGMSVTSTTAVADARRDTNAALLIAGLCAIGMALTWTLAALVPATHVRDAIGLYDFTRLDGPVVEALAKGLLDLLEPWIFIVWGLILVVCALSQRRPQVALAVAVVLGLAPGSAELLKPLLAHPHAHIAHLYIKDASWPSGHATAAMTLAWCAVIVAAPAYRLVVALVGVVLTGAVGYALLILAWHMPSDVLGGYLLGTLWAALAVASVQAERARLGAQASGSAVSLPCAPGAHSDSDPASASSFAARLRINSMSDNRFR
jgi:membrane-associated phospholipid phosphatase